MPPLPSSALLGLGALLAMVLLCPAVWAQNADSPRSLQIAEGPDGGWLFDLTITPDGKVLALGGGGTYRFDEQGRWVKAPIFSNADALAEPLPLRVGMEHLVGVEGLYTPHSITFAASGRHVLLLNQSHELWWSSRPEGSWSPASLPEPPGRPLAESAWVELEATEADLTMVQASGSGDEVHSRVWRYRGARGEWTWREMEGRVGLLRRGSGSRAATWRAPDSRLPSGGLARGHQVDRFVSVDNDEDELDWVGLLHESDPDVLERCRGVMALLQASTPAQEGEPPVVLAVGPRSLCVSTDGGESFRPREGLFLRPPDKRFFGDLSLATIFPWSDADAGVRILVATRPVFDPEAPPGRVFGGRLFLSDDAGRTWTNATPDIEGPGAFLDLEVRLLAAGEPTVWLLTGRRGLYRSVAGGHGFIRSSEGLFAQPIHALTPDVLNADQVWAAGPTGLYRFSGSWTRERITPMRTLVARRGSGQLWGGGYFGQVLILDDKRTWISERLYPDPSPESADPPKTLDKQYPEPSGMTVQAPPFPPPIPLATAVRPVATVIPAGKRAGIEVGYALVDGGDIFRRIEAERWTKIEPPPGDTPVVLAATSIRDANHKQSEEQLLLFTRIAEGPAIAWRFDPRSGSWTQHPLPDGVYPLDVLRPDPERVLLASASGGVQLVRLRDGQLLVEPMAGAPGNALCQLLTMGATPSSAFCAHGAASPDGAAVGRGSGARLLAALSRFSLDEGDGVQKSLQPIRYLADNPRGRDFTTPVSIVETENAVGQQIWISPGLNVYTTPDALEPLLPAEVSPPLLERIPWGWIALVITGLLGALLALVLIRRSAELVNETFIEDDDKSGKPEPEPEAVDDQTPHRDEDPHDDDTNPKAER